ncbi:hypothetical protein ACHQM5_029240 [Ranunculus cassubicifolius]
MDDTEDDARYYSSNQGSNHHHRPKLPVRNVPPLENEYSEDEDDEEEEEEVVGEEELGDEGDEDDEEDDEDEGQKMAENGDEEEGDDEEEDDEREENDNDNAGSFYRRDEIEEEAERLMKKRKMKSSGNDYEFAPRVSTIAANTPSAVGASGVVTPKPHFGGRNSPADWNEHATFALLDAWGDRFLQLGRKSLHSDEWHEVAKQVSQTCKMVRTDTQCRNRLDTLKKKYKKEKIMMAETGETSSKWVYFKKMDMLLTSSTSRQPGLSCGLDSGEYVYMNPKSYLNSNGLDEMRDTPGNSESSEGNDDDSDGLPPKRTRSVEASNGKSSFRLLAESIQKFGEIYEKIENSKRQQMVELEKMRMEFHRDLELQKRQIMERAHAEIAKIRQGDDEEIDVSTENTSG